MRILGIDYGSKRVGIALSDEAGQFAMPLIVLKNNKELLEEVRSIVTDNKVETIVMGESKSYKGEMNTIMEQITPFKALLEKELSIKVIFEPEFMTSVAAERFQGKNDMHDASAAALILQSFLDRDH